MKANNHTRGSHNARGFDFSATDQSRAFRRLPKDEQITSLRHGPYSSDGIDAHVPYGLCMSRICASRTVAKRPSRFVPKVVEIVLLRSREDGEYSHTISVNFRLT